MMQQLCQGGLSGADDAGPSPLTGLAGWRRMVETGRRRVMKLTGWVRERQHWSRLGAVAYHHQVSVRATGVAGSVVGPNR